MSGVMINNNNQVGLAGVGKGVEVGKEFTCAYNHKKWSGRFIDVSQKYVDSSFLRVKKKKKLAGLLHVGLGLWVCIGIPTCRQKVLCRRSRTGLGSQAH
jgi:hypothetical protein